VTAFIRSRQTLVGTVCPEQLIGPVSIYTTVAAETDRLTILTVSCRPDSAPSTRSGSAESGQRAILFNYDGTVTRN
jgi:hypothetical protein